MNDIWKPLTPELRRKIDEGFDQKISELLTCERNNLVQCQIRAMQVAKNFFHGLPDGYPIPFRKD